MSGFGTIEWKDGSYGTRSASIGRVRLFTASWATTRDDPDRPVCLRCTLPGFERKVWRCASYEEAEASAPTVLRTWLREIGLSDE